MHAPCIHLCLDCFPMSQFLICQVLHRTRDDVWTLLENAEGNCLQALIEQVTQSGAPPSYVCWFIIPSVYLQTIIYIYIITIYIYIHYYIYITYPGIQNHYCHNGGSLTTMFKPKPRMVVHLGVSARFGPSNHRDMIVVSPFIFWRCLSRGFHIPPGFCFGRRVLHLEGQC